MTSTTSSADGSPRERTHSTPRWITLTIAFVFTILFAYDLWEAIGNLVGLTGGASTLGISLTTGALVLLIVNIALPVGVCAGAYVSVRRRSAWAQLIVFLLAYILVQVLTLDIESLVSIGPFDVG